MRLADHITRLTPMITMGMGCGSVCGTVSAKKYADFVQLEAELQNKRVAA